MTRALDDLILAAILACVGLASCLDCDGAHAQIRARSVTHREPAEVSIARFLCGEADARKVEAAPLLWTMQHRATRHGLELVPMIRAYSAPLRGHGGRRGAWVRALPVLPTPGYASHWRDAIDAARSWIAGTIPDPCERPTLHFGSRADMRARWPDAVPVDCGEGSRANVYITENGT